jgi:hypothetical protein
VVTSKPPHGGAVLVAASTDVGGEHQHLGTEPVGGLGDELGPGDGGGVDADLVGTRPQQPVDIVDGAHSPPTVSGMKTSSAVRATTSNIVARSPLLAVTSRKVSSSAPCSP